MCAAVSAGERLRKEHASSSARTVVYLVSTLLYKLPPNARSGTSRG